MEIKDIYNILNKEIEENYPSRAEIARKLDISRSVFQNFMNKLKTGNGIKLKTLKKICDVLGYEIIVTKKRR